MSKNIICYVGLVLVATVSTCVTQSSKPAIPTVDFDTLDRQLRKHYLVPEIVETTPRGLALVRWPSGREAYFGTAIPYEDLKEPPEVRWDNNSSMFYSMLFTDCDDPEGEHWDENLDRREYHIWFVFNIPGDDISKGVIQHPYIPPTVNKTKVQHRIAVSVIEQLRDFNPNSTLLFRPPRFYFTVMQVVKEYMGTPHAGNFFYAQPPVVT